jgi:hypothetical protein
MSKILIFGAPGAGCSHMRWLLLACTEWRNKQLIDIKKFFETQVYPINRTWHNWLTYEKKFKRLLDNQTEPNIELLPGSVHHGLFADLSQTAQGPTDINLFCMADNTIIKKYAMINSYLDGADLFQLINFTAQWHNTIKNKHFHNKILWQYDWFLDNNEVVKQIQHLCTQCGLEQPNPDLIRSINQMWLDCWNNLCKDFNIFFKIQ